MKQLHVLASLALVIAACSPETSGVNAAETRDAGREPASSAEPVAPSLAAELHGLGHLAKDRVAGLADAVRNTLAGADEQLAALRNKLQGAQGSAQEELSRTLADLAEKRKALSTKLGELRDLGGEKLEAAQRELEDTRAELAQDLADALERFE